MQPVATWQPSAVTFEKYLTRLKNRRSFEDSQRRAWIPLLSENSSIKPRVGSSVPFIGICGTCKPRLLFQPPEITAGEAPLSHSILSPNSDQWTLEVVVISRAFKITSSRLLVLGRTPSSTEVTSFSSRVANSDEHVFPTSGQPDATPSNTTLYR